MNQTRFSLLASIVLLVCLTIMMSQSKTFAETTTTRRLPNIVFVMTDDLGWSDVGFNGATFYETPNLDKMAAEGMNFTRAYSGGPNCLPTRACLISGMYTPRTQIWTPGGKSKGKLSHMKLLVPNFVTPVDTFPSKLQLEPSVTSLAEVLKAAGYKTARFGKWHVGKDTQGFDISDPNGKGAKIGKKFYGNIDVHESLTDASCKFINDNRDGPFFLYLSHWDVHTPIRARKTVKAKYAKKLKEGNWDRKWNTTYAAMIEAVDKSVGRVQNKLKQLDLENNTLFIFTSDNGGVTGVTTNHPLKGSKGSFYEGGVRVPTFMRWPGVIKEDTKCNTPITSVDFMPTFAELAGTSVPTNQPVDGASIVPLLHGNKIETRAIFWHFPLYLKSQGNGRVFPISGTQQLNWRGVPSSMICKGDWKLMHLFEDDSIRLYNVATDISESEDLAARHPKMAQQLLAELKSWQKKTKAVIPTQLNPAFEKSKNSKLK